MCEIQAAVRKSYMRHVRRHALYMLFFIPFAIAPLVTTTVRDSITGEMVELTLLANIVTSLVGIIPISILTTWIVKRIPGIRDFYKTEIWLNLVARNEDDEFFKTIHNEIYDPDTTEYHTKRIDGEAWLWVTPTWLIVISRKGSFIRKVAELERVHHWGGSTGITAGSGGPVSGIDFHFSDRTKCMLRPQQISVELDIYEKLVVAIPDIIYETDHENILQRRKEKRMWG